MQGGCLQTLRNREQHLNGIPPRFRKWFYHQLQRRSASHALSQAIHSSMTQALWGSSAQTHAGMCRPLECRLEAQGNPGNIHPAHAPNIPRQQNCRNGK